MIQVSRSLARLGHEVIAFYNVAYPAKYDGVDYLPMSSFVPLVTTLEHDALISWDNSDAFRFADRARMRVLAFQLNNAMVGVFDHAVDLYMHPSEWHVDRFCAMYPEMSRKKCRARITNGIDPLRYVAEVPREPHRVIYSSSPDRGLHHLLRIWPQVLEKVPDAELNVFYEITNWLKMVELGGTAEVKERARLVEQARQNGLTRVTFHGGIGQRQLAIEQLKSAVMVYPCDPVQPTEGFSMTCLEAVTAGCSLITSNADALKELWADAPGVKVLPLPIDDGVWIDTIVKELLSDQVRVSKVNPDYTWLAIAKRWEQELTECLTEH
jgi:glycosyltransferase involved in cell wall biosynthesis